MKGEILDSFCVPITRDGKLTKLAKKYLKGWSDVFYTHFGNCVEEITIDKYYQCYFFVTKERFPHKGHQEAKVEITTQNILK